MAVMFVLFSLTILLCNDLIDGHGRMLNPVQRSSMWRYGYDTPFNYDDTALNCGGLQIMYDQNGGNCGPCGDDFASPVPRNNELGGFFGGGTVVDTYEMGSNIPVFIQLTASHLGFFHFDVCNSNGKPETDDCFIPLLLANGEREIQVPTFDAQNFTATITLPEGFFCDRCTIRWHYKTGNNVGLCGDGTSSVDCANQETFRNCADVEIVGSS